MKSGNLNFLEPSGPQIVSSVHVVSLAHAMKAYMGREGVHPLILNIGIRWRSVVNFTSHLPFPGKGPRCPFNRRLGESQSLSGRFGEHESASAGVVTSDCQARDLVTVLTTQFNLIT